MPKTLYLVKASDDLISHCHCANALIGSPAQMDCPWCGCGWLCVCAGCRKAFTFARAEEVAHSWNELAHKDLDGKWGRNPSEADVAEWVSAMKILLKHIKPGREYVYLDGFFLPTSSHRLRLDGWHAHHELEELPQVVALHSASIIDRTIGSREYWSSRRLQQND